VGGAKVSTEAIVLATEHIVSLQSRLKKDPSDFPAWLDLGMYQKMAGDYQGTVISWTYAGRLAPTDYISQGNLGNLYAYFLKDNAKAEMYYKKAIANNGVQAYLYVQLAEVYRDLFKDSAKALAIVNQGLVKIPNNGSLLEVKATLQ
jgi:tetratricopeptide (TPR) repeat protein